MKSPEHLQILWRKQNWSGFLVISSIEDGALTKLSPFVIQKAIVGLAGEPKCDKKINKNKFTC